MARSVPALMKGSVVGSTVTTMGMWPATASLTEGAQPLCGTCNALMPMAWRYISMAKCGVLAMLHAV
jgi:hypothetical protein